MYNIPVFRNFLWGRFLITLALQLQFVLITWYVYQLTKDPASLAYIGFCEAVPAISLALYAGQWVDKLEKRIVYFYFVFFSLLISLAMMLLVWLKETGQVDSQLCVRGFYVLIFFFGVIRSFSAPAISSIWPKLIPPDLLAKAAGASSTVWQAGAILGPLLGGFFIELLGVFYSFGVLVLITVVCLGLVFLLPKIYAPAQANMDHPWRRMKEGLAYVYNNKLLLGTMSLDLFSVFFGGVTAILPIFAEEILQTGGSGFGFLRAAPSMGSVLMLLWLSFYPTRSKTGLKLLVAVGLFGLSTLLFGISKWYWFSWLMMFFSGLFDGFSIVVRNIVSQLSTPDSMRGRVSAVISIFVSSSNELGAMESGFAAKWFGLVRSVVGGSLCTMGIVTAMGYFNKELRDFELKNFEMKKVD